MPKYEFDARRYCSNNRGRMGHMPDGTPVADLIICEIDSRNVRIEALKMRLAEVEEQSVHVYNSGYHAGHHDTVEGRYVDIHPSDMDSYHAEEVAELREALAKLEEK